MGVEGDNLNATFAYFKSIPDRCSQSQGGARPLVKTCRQLRPLGFKEGRIVKNSCWLWVTASGGNI